MSGATIRPSAKPAARPAAGPEGARAAGGQDAGAGLGQRIAEAAAVCVVAEIDHGTGSPEAENVWAELLTLCDRADAAERLAKVASAMKGIFWLGGSAALAALEEWQVGE